MGYTSFVAKKALGVGFDVLGDSLKREYQIAARKVGIKLSLNTCALS